MKKVKNMQGRRCLSAVDIQHSSPTDNNRQPGVNWFSKGGKFSTVPDDDSIHSYSMNNCLKTVSQHSMTSSIPIDEQLSHIFKTIGENSNDLLKAWDLFSPFDDPQRRVLNIHFRLMIDQLCPHVSNGDQTFQMILQRLQPMSKHVVSYEEFRNKLLDNSCQVIDTRDIYEYFDRTTALEEVEIHLRNKVITNVAVICRMLLLVDRRQNGSVHISDMKKIIRHCCQIHMHDNTYNKLWLRYDPRHTQLIDYADFLKRLAINVSNYRKTRHNLNMKTALTWPEVEMEQDDSHQKRLAILRSEDDLHLRDQPLDEIYQRLQSKVWSGDKVLTKAFEVLDAIDTGRVLLEACRTLLSYFTFALSPNTFNRILCRLGLDATEAIEWKTFLNRIKGHQWNRKWSSALTRRLNDVTNKHPQSVSALTNNVAVIDEVKRAVKCCQGRQLLHHFNYKTQGEPCITRQELRLVLSRLGIRMSQQQFKQLTVKLDPNHTNLVTYQRFCQFFVDSDDRKPVGTPLEQPELAASSLRRTSSRSCSASDGSSVHWPKLLAKLKERVHINYDNIEKVLRSCDYQRQGWISPTQLRRLLNHFCFPLNNEEFTKVLYELQDVQGMINVRKFNQTFYQTEKERLQKWSSLVSRLTKAGVPHPWTHEQLDCMWTQLMATFGSSLVAQFKQLQQDNVSEVPRHQYHQQLCTYTGWLYEDEFDYLWDRYLGLALDNLDELVNTVEVVLPEDRGEDTQSVAEFERHSSQQEVASEVDERPTSRPKTTSLTQRSPMAAKREQRRRPKTVGPRGYFSADIALRRVLAQRWTDIKQRCLETDLDKNYTLPAHTFLDILSEAGIPITSKYLLRLLPLKYNIPSLNPQAPVDYIKFLTNLFLTCGSNDNKEELPAAVGNILLDARKPILSQWKTINRIFHRHDVLGTGKIHMSKFLKILSQHEVKLSDNEVMLLSQYLDPQTTGAIRYKDFFHIFMKSVV